MNGFLESSISFSYWIEVSLDPNILDPVKGELDTVELNSINKIYELSLEHSIQIYLGSDHQYEVRIDGRGSYGSWITFFGALCGGIDLYNNKIINEGNNKLQ